MTDFSAIRRALEALPAACRYHGDRLDSGSPWRVGCCDTGRPSRLRRDALAQLDQAEALLAEEERACAERGRWLAEVDAALIRAGEDEGGGYIAYPRRIDQLAADRDRFARWEHHWRWIAVQAASRVTAARELHRPAMRGGVATGMCICGAPCPCPTSKALPRPPDVCDCGPDCPRNAGETAPEWTGRREEAAR